MKRNITALVLCLAAALALVGCGSAETAKPAEEEIVGADPSTWGPEEHETLEAAEAAADIEMTVPDDILGSKPTVFLTWYERAYIDAVYTDADGNNTARVRKAAGSDDRAATIYPATTMITPRSTRRPSAETPSR